MILRTHLLFSFFFGSFFLSFTGISPLAFFILAAAGSLIPDMDHRNSWINNKLKISKALPYFTEHRGVMHSLLFGAGISALVWVIFGIAYAVPIFAGFISHLLIDGLTPAGINFLHPIGSLHLRGFIETGSWKEDITFVLILILTMIQLNKLYLHIF